MDQYQKYYEQKYEEACGYSAIYDIPIQDIKIPVPGSNDNFTVNYGYGDVS